MTTNKKTDEEEYLSTEEIRSHLRWRVYFFLFVQILVATGVIYSIFHIKTLHTILLNNLDVLYIAELTGILCLFMLSMYEEMRCDTECGSPVNLVTLGIYSVALAIHACGTVHLYTTQQNRMAAFITSAAFLVLSQCAYHTNHDFFVAGGNAVMYTYSGSRLISSRTTPSSCLCSRSSTSSSPVWTSSRTLSLSSLSNVRTTSYPVPICTLTSSICSRARWL
ncbi:uncharacterized protein LOC103507182 isoform X2 [Diaphorina citri]|uniref:Uncharacterized protein LOC103507182 isoform X2 n=1 Tax=Diaphorina citri TaxID=121845 RepID=A0A3Q0IU80_DIACI|nr:uncharacterized protein LOC103507182 isoform X2 [Diaphorina citri]